MPDLTPQFVMQYERRMRAISESEYARRLLAQNTWWNKLLRQTDIEGKSERITWLLSTAIIEAMGPSGVGDIAFENMVTQTVEYPVLRHAKGIRVQRDQLEDLNGTGLDQLAEWSSQVGNETSYYPQRLASQLLLNGAASDGSANAYDGKPFFAPNNNQHPYNPFKTSLGGYSNWLKGASSGSYPGALPIDDSVTVDVALQNLGKAIAYVAGWKMPNGVDPRFLMPKYIVCPPRMAPRVRQLTDAKLIAQAAATGGGGADVQKLISGWALGEPIVAQELAASSSYNFQVATADPVTGFLTSKSVGPVAGSDTTWYLVCQEINTTQLGGLLLVMRKPFKITYYSGDGTNGASALEMLLDRMNEVEYHVQGRMSVQYGHPYTTVRVDNS